MDLLAPPAEPGAVAAPALTRRLPLVGALAAVAVFIAWFLALAETGSGVPTTARWSVAVLCAVLLPGLALVRAVRRASVPLVEDLAWAVPAGCLVALCGWFLDRVLPAGPNAFMLGPAVVVALLLFPATRRRLVARPAPGWGAGPALVLAGVQMIALGWTLVTGLLAHQPDPGPHGTTYYPDIMYNLALAGELGHHLVPTYPPVAGATLSYHWFLFAITDHVTSGAHVSLFDATMRLGPASLVPATILLVAVVARRLADRIWAGPLAAVLLGAVELSQATRWSTEDGSPGMLQRAWFTSTPQALGWVAGLAAAGTVIAFLRRAPADRAVPVVLVLPFLLFAAGAKSPELFVVLAGIGLALLAQLVRRNWPEVRRCVLLLAGGAAVYELAAHTVYAGSSYGIHLRWFAAALDRISVMFPGYAWQVTPYRLTGLQYDRSAILTVAVMWLLPLLPRLAGLPFLLRDRRDAAAWFCTGAAAAGLAVPMLFGHPAGSEVYFMQSAYPIGVAGSATGLLLAADRLRGRLRAPGRRRAALAGAALVIGGGVAAAVIAYTQPGDTPVMEWARTHTQPISAGLSVYRVEWLWLRPTVEFLVVLAVLTVAVWLLRRRVASWLPTAGLAAIAVALGAGLFTMSLTFGGTTAPVQGSPQAVQANDAGLIRHGVLPTMRDAFAAGAYVNAHAGPDDVVATNMYCRFSRAARRAGLAGCDARNFVASALTERRTLVGGWAYSDRAVDDAWAQRYESYKNEHFWDAALYDEQFEALAHPTPSLLDDLYSNYRVRWIFADLRDPPVNVVALDRLAQVRFVGPSTEVWQLRPPGALAGTGA